MLHPLPLPLSSCLGCIPPLIGLPSLRFYAVGSSLFLLSVCFCLCSLFYRDDVLCWLLLARPFLYAFHAHLRFPVDLVWFRLSCDHGWIRSGSVNVRKQQQQQQLRYHQSPHICSHILRGGTFLLFSCRALFRNKSGTTELDTGPNTEESKPEGRLTRGRACRKLGGAGSSPKNTSIVETLRDFSIAYRHHPVKQQRARMPCRS